MALKSVLNWFGKQAITFVDDKYELYMRTQGAKIVATAKSLVAVDTGLLKNSIRYVYTRQSRTLTIRVYPHYGFFQEYGTRFMPAHPYILPALAKAGWFVGSVGISFGGIRTRRNPMPLPRANARIVADNTRLHQEMAHKFRWKRKPVVGFRTKQLAASLHGYKPPYKALDS